MSITQRYVGWLRREANWVSDPIKAEVMRQAARHMEDTEKRFRSDIETLYSQGQRLALELECLLLSCADTAATSKWWDSAHEALGQWRDFRGDDDDHSVESDEMVSETAIPAIVFYPAGSLGEPVEDPIVPCDDSSTGHIMARIIHANPAEI